MSIGASKIHNPRQIVVTLDHDVQNKSDSNLKKYRLIEEFAKKQGRSFQSYFSHLQGFLKSPFSRHGLSGSGNADSDLDYRSRLLPGWPGVDSLCQNAAANAYGWQDWPSDHG